MAMLWKEYQDLVEKHRAIQRELYELKRREEDPPVRKNRHYSEGYKCEGCGEVKPIHGLGLCEPCYQHRYYIRRKKLNKLTPVLGGIPNVRT